MTLIICKEIRHVKNGYIVELRYPYGDEPGGYGEVVCKTLEEVFELLKTSDIEK